jgi:hypothetical protein
MIVGLSGLELLVCARFLVGLALLFNFGRVADDIF